MTFARGVLIALTLGLGVGCKDLGQALEPQSTTATITLWTSDPAPSYIAVAVDGSNVGTLTAYRTGAPSCGAGNSAGTITVTVPPGDHVISAYETSGSGTWGPSSVTVDGGKCLTYELQP